MTLLTGIRAVLLDIDGTLFSSEDILLEVYHRALADFRSKNGRPDILPDLQTIMQQIGQPVKKIFQNLVPELTEDERDEISGAILHDLVDRISKGEGVHYEGVTETLKRLHESKIRLFTASNGRRAYIEAILKAAGVDSLFEAVPAIDNVRILNKEDLVATTLHDYGLRPEECVIVGDRTTDRDAASVNGIAFIATLYGHHANEVEHDGAVAKIQRFNDLLSILGISD